MWKLTLRYIPHGTVDIYSNISLNYKLWISDSLCRQGKVGAIRSLQNVSSFVLLCHKNEPQAHREGGKKNWNKNFWEEIIAYFPFIRHGPHKERRVQQFFYCCVCISCRGNVFLRSRCLATIGGIHIQTHRLMEGIYELGRWDGMRCYDIHTKFHRDWFRRSKDDTQTHRHAGRVVIS
jgi:hypothetical protein